MDSSYWILTLQATLFFSFISLVYSDDDCDDDDDDCPKGSGVVILGIIFGSIAGILIILIIITVVCVKFCKTKKHGAVISPGSGNTNPVSQGYTRPPHVYTVGYTYSSPTAPTYSEVTSQTFITPSTGGFHSTTENVPPPPSYEEFLSNSTSPPKY